MTTVLAAIRTHGEYSRSSLENFIPKNTNSLFVPQV